MFTLNNPPIRNNLTSASLLSMLIETDYLNYPPIRNNLSSASLPLSKYFLFQIHTIGNYCANYEHLPTKMKDVCVTSCLTGFKYTHAHGVLQLLKKNVYRLVRPRGMFVSGYI